MSKPRKLDGLTKTQRYRLKNIDAYRERKREYAKTPEERAKRTEYMRQWREKNRARHNELCLQSHNRHKDDPGKYEKRRSQHYMRKYGITYEQALSMLDAQNGACLLCEERVDKWVVDHCHKTNNVRGILCYGCNTALGAIEAIKLENLIKYLG